MTPQQLLLLTDDEILKHIAQQTQELRKQKKMTQKEFAKKAGISYGTYIKFENKGVISLKRFLTILRYLGRLKNILSLLEKESVQDLGIKAYMSQRAQKNSDT